jgi:sRNA-binding protein
MKKTYDWVAIHQAQKALAVLHPELFSLENPVPLKISIHHDVKARFPEMRVRIRYGLLMWLTSRRAYLAICTEGAIRYGFEGPCGEVTAAEAAFAAQKFAEREATSKPLQQEAA